MSYAYHQGNRSSAAAAAAATGDPSFVGRPSQHTPGNPLTRDEHAWSRERHSTAFPPTYSAFTSQSQRIAPPTGPASVPRSSLNRPPLQRPRHGGSRISWPPSPSVESERESLAKEANPPKPADNSDVPLRGATDQEPTLLGPFPLDRHGNVVSDSESDVSAGYWSEASSTVSASNLRHEYGRPELRSSTRFADVNSSKTTSSPVSTRPPPFPAAGALPKQDQNTKRQAFVDECLRSDVLRGDGKARIPSKPHDHSGDVSSSDAMTDDDWVDIGRASGRVPAPYSMNPRNLQDKHQMNAKPDASARVADLRRPEARRSTDSASSLPKPQLGARPDRPPPLKPFLFGSTVAASPVTTPTGKGNLSGDYLSHSRPESLSGSRPASPNFSNVNRLSSTPNSPRVSREVPPSAWQQNPRSRPGSRDSSRPPSPQDRLEDTLRRASTFPMQPEDRSVKRSSKLASSSMRADQESPISPSRTQAAALPYPVDDLNIPMPSENNSRYRAIVQDAAYVSQTLAMRSHSNNSSRKSSIASDSALNRPRPSSRHTADGVLPTLAALTGAAGAAAMAAKYDAARPRDSGIGSVAREPAACLRFHSTREHDDWFTISGSPKFDICPDCLENFFGNSPLRKQFKRQRRKDSDEKTKCDFSSPWMRSAFALAQAQRHDDLELIRAISDANAKEQSCTGERNDARKWYTLRDREGEPLNAPIICPRDVRKITAMFPTLQDSFVKSPYAGQRGRCDMRASSDHFDEALSVLISIDADAAARRRRANLQDFIEFFNKRPKPIKTGQCPRDTPRESDDWYFIAKLPEFTVCPSCYTAVVWPAIAGGSSVAKKFNQTPARIRPDTSIDKRGASCQLYSRRMRDVFRRAVDRDDLAMLAHYAQKRKANEVRLADEVERLCNNQRMSKPALAASLQKIREEWIYEHE